MTAIPKHLTHIWIGPRPAPLEWMKTWCDFHPDWEYQLIDNAYVAKTKFRNQIQIDEYLRRSEFAGAADLIRYEVLLERGGFMPGADSICLRNTDELWTRAQAYTVYESEFMRGKLVSPILACNPGNDFVAALIERLNEVPVSQLDKPWITTGNYFVAQMIEELKPDITVFPSHYFIPKHYTGHTYTGDGPVYCQQLFGETTKAYAKMSFWGKIKKIRGKLRSKKMRKGKRS